MAQDQVFVINTLEGVMRKLIQRGVVITVLMLSAGTALAAVIEKAACSGYCEYACDNNGCGPRCGVRCEWL